MKRILSILLVVLSLNIYGQNVIYVATTGSDDTGDGTIGNPYATVQYALDQTQDNDTVILRGGTYTSEEIRIEHNNITIKSQPNEWAIIQAVTDVEDITSCIWYHEPTINGGRLERLEIIGGYLYGVKLESDWNWGAPIPDRHGTKNIVITHCKIHDTGRDCIKIPSGCDSIIVENCTIFNSGIGISNDPNDPNAEGIDMVNNDDVIIRNNFVYNTSTSGIYAKGGCINTIIENNLIMNAGENGIDLGFYTDGEWFDTIANPNCYGNLNGIVRNNIIINTNMDGIGMYGAYNPKVYNNTVINAAQTDHAALFFNTNDTWFDETTYIDAPCVDVYVVNNIFTVTSTLPIAQIRYIDDDTSTNMRGNCIVDHNLYSKGDSIATFDDGIDWQTLNLEQWRTSTGFDINTIEADPLLDDNYHLATGSPCIDAATDVSGLTIDYDGNPRTSPFDIGADEFNAGNNLQVPPDSNSLGTGNDSIVATSLKNIKTANRLNISIFPNPANSVIYINNYQDCDYWEIFDASGNTVKKSNGDITPSINVSNLPKGTYFIWFNRHDKNKVLTFLKK